MLRGALENMRHTALLLLILCFDKALSFSAGALRVGNTPAPARSRHAGVWTERLPRLGACIVSQGRMSPGVQASEDEGVWTNAPASPASEEEIWAAQRACARLSDSHVAAFQKDGFVTLRQGVPAEFDAYLAAVQEGPGNPMGSLQELARKTPPRALVRKEHPTF